MNLSFIITTYARSGTHFLQGLLRSTGLADAHEVHKRPDFTGNLPRDFENMEEDLWVGYDRAASQRHFGCFIHAHDMCFLDYLVDTGKVDIHNIRWISLVRLNKLNQALSYIIANEKTQLWHLLNENDYTAVPEYTQFDDISKEHLYFYVMRCFLADQIWDRFYRDHSIQPHQLFYEHFLAECTWKQTVAGIFDYLGVSYDKHLLNPRPQTKKFGGERVHPLIEETKRELSPLLDLRCLPHL